MEKEVFVESIYDSLSAEATAGKHKIKISEPFQFGGNEEGPDPYAYLLTALGSCAVITLQMYAQRKDWPLEKVQIKLNHRRNHHIDCERCETDPSAKLDFIEVLIGVSGNLSEDQVEKLGTIATKCPVHKTLETGISIKTKIQQAVLTV